jgi:hypothetical protein
VADRDTKVGHGENRQDDLGGLHFFLFQPAGHRSLFVRLLPLIYAQTGPVVKVC